MTQTLKVLLLIFFVQASFAQTDEVSFLKKFKRFSLGRGGAARFLGVPQLPQYEDEPLSPESKMSNFVVEALNEGWQQKGATNVVVSIPMSLPAVNATKQGRDREPVLRSTLTEFRDGTKRVRFQFMQKQKDRLRRITVHYLSLTEDQTISSESEPIEGRRSSGLETFDWNVPNHLALESSESKISIWIEVPSWSHRVPIEFYFPKVQTQIEAEDIDPLQVLEGSTLANEIPKLTLLKKELPQDWTKVSPRIWKTDLTKSNFTKNVYHCLDSSRPQAPTWTQPTEPGEIYLNSIENRNALVGIGKSLRKVEGADSLPWSEVGVFRLLLPGESFLARPKPHFVWTSNLLTAPLCLQVLIPKAQIHP